MPLNWVTLKFRPDSDDPFDPTQFQEVSSAAGLPVAIVDYGPPSGWTYYPAPTTGTYIIARAPGVLHAVVVNTTAAGAITIYDNTAGSGTKIGTLKASIAEGSYYYDAKFLTGLTLVLAAASDVTVLYAS